MSYMKVRCTFVTTKQTPDEPELAIAWDEYQIDNWPEGYEAAVKKALADYEGEVDKVVTVDLSLNYVNLLALFQPKVMQTGMTEVPNEEL